MLDLDRKYYVTGSAAYRVMAGFEAELSGKDMECPAVVAGFLEWLSNFKAKPTVGRCRDSGFDVTGAQITESWKYLKAITPVFSEGMESVAREIAMNEFYEGERTTFRTDATEHGNRTEVEAVKALSEKIGKNIDSIGDNQKFLSSGNLGVSPDGIIMDGFNILELAEVKCPQPEKHMEYLVNVSDQESLLDVMPAYYWQCQCGLAVTDADCYHWMSYHPGFLFDTTSVYIKVEPNHDHIELLKTRADRVAARVPEIIQQIYDKYLNEKI